MISRTKRHRKLCTDAIISLYPISWALRSAVGRRVKLWGNGIIRVRDGPLFFWRGGEGGMKNLSLQTFFLIYAPLQTIFSNNTFLQRIFFIFFNHDLTQKGRRFCYHQSLFNSIFYDGEQ